MELSKCACLSSGKQPVISHVDLASLLDLEGVPTRGGRSHPGTCVPPVSSRPALCGALVPAKIREGWSREGPLLRSMFVNKENVFLL